MPGVKRPWIVEERPTSKGKIKWGWHTLSTFASDAAAYERLFSIRAYSPASYEYRVRIRESA